MKTAKDRALYLFYLFYNTSTNEPDYGINVDLAKKCAYECVCETIYEMETFGFFGVYTSERIQFLNDVKQEIINIK